MAVEDIPLPDWNEIGEENAEWLAGLLAEFIQWSLAVIPPESSDDDGGED